MRRMNHSKIKLIISMVIFGTIGIFRRYIPLSSGLLAFFRGCIGTLFLLALIYLKGSKLNFKSIRSNLKFLIISGAAIGINWILLFEAYQYTSVATATLCYYMAPIIVILLSPFFLKEECTIKKIICVMIALFGMILVSGVLDNGLNRSSEWMGIMFGLGAAAFYASVIMMNKKLKDIDAYDKTIVQLAMSALIVSPYVLFTENLSGIIFNPLMIVMILMVGIIHTGIAYALYFGSMKDLKAQTVALFSYIDPIVAILLSALLLQESMQLTEMVGSILVLGATFISEYE